MNNVATWAAWTAPQALTVNQLFSSAWKDSNPCKYKTLSTAWQWWREREGGMEGRVSNLTFDPTNKRHVSFRIAFQRGAPGAEWASFVILAVWGWLTGAGVGAQHCTIQQKNSTSAQSWERRQTEHVYYWLPTQTYSCCRLGKNNIRF